MNSEQSWQNSDKLFSNERMVGIGSSQLGHRDASSRWEALRKVFEKTGKNSNVFTKGMDFMWCS